MERALRHKELVNITILTRKSPRKMGNKTFLRFTEVTGQTHTHKSVEKKMQLQPRAVGFSMGLYTVGRCLIFRSVECQET